MAYRIDMPCETLSDKGKIPVNPSVKRVLVADDDRSVRALVAHHFREAPWETVFAVDADEAAALFADGAFDLALLDLEMPGGGGVAAAKAMRRVERERGLSPACLLALSAHAAEPGFALPEGFDGALPKPFSAALRDEVARRLERAAPAAAGETDEALRHLIPKVAASLDELGASARAALECGDFRALGRVGHTMLGTASCFGVRGAAAVARDLEQAAEQADATLAEAALARLPQVLDALSAS